MLFFFPEVFGTAPLPLKEGIPFLRMVCPSTLRFHRACKSGQNVRLASQLTGWELNVMTVADLEAKQQSENSQVIEVFVSGLEIDEEFAGVLADEGFTSLEEIAYVPVSELLDIEGLDEDIIEELRNRARAYLTTKALANEESLEPKEELLNLAGMTNEIAVALAKQGVTDLEELAEQGTDEICDIEGLDEKSAGEFIFSQDIGLLWKQTTPFASINGNLAFKNGVMSNQDFKADLDAININGKGTVNLPKQALNYRVGLNIQDNLFKKSCSVNNKIQGIEWPVDCKGNFSDDPMKLCKPDLSVVEKILKKALKDKLKKKLEKKLGGSVKAKKAELKKKVEQKKEELKQKVEDEVKDKLKGALKGLF